MGQPCARCRRAGDGRVTSGAVGSGLSGEEHEGNAPQYPRKRRSFLDHIFLEAHMVAAGMAALIGVPWWLRPLRHKATEQS